MEKVNRAINKALIWSLIITILLPVGIIMTIFGGINKIWVLLAFGIAFIVVGFYGCPLLWVKYGNSIGYKRVVSAVAVEKIYSIETIASHLNLNVKVVVEKVDTCIRREFLLGYIREGDTIRPNVNINANTIGYKCPACGARFESPLHSQPKCPYCDTVIN